MTEQREPLRCGPIELKWGVDFDLPNHLNLRYLLTSWIGKVGNLLLIVSEHDCIRFGGEEGKTWHATVNVNDMYFYQKDLFHKYNAESPEEAVEFLAKYLGGLKEDLKGL